jgi:hypothetical protein
LLAAQEDVPRHRALNAGQKPPVLSQKRHGHPVLRAVTEEERARGHISEAHNSSERVYRDARLVGLLHADEHALAFLGKIGALSRDEQGVQVFLHGSSSAFFK